MKQTGVSHRGDFMNKKSSFADFLFPILAAAIGAVLATYLFDAIGATLVLIITSCILFAFKMLEQDNETYRS